MENQLNNKKWDKFYYIHTVNPHPPNLFTLPVLRWFASLLKTHEKNQPKTIAVDSLYTVHSFLLYGSKNITALRPSQLLLLSRYSWFLSLLLLLSRCPCLYCCCSPVESVTSFCAPSWGSPWPACRRSWSPGPSPGRILEKMCTIG